MEAIKRMGVQYGKLGLATQASLIEARAEGLAAASQSMTRESVPGLVGCALGLKDVSLQESFWSSFSAKDPTFDVDPRDREAALLAASTIAACIESKLQFSDYLALCFVTASFGGMRPAIADDQLFTRVEKALVDAQSAGGSEPEDRRYTKQPQALKQALDALAQPASRQQPATGVQHAHTALTELAAYAESNALAAAVNDNAILEYLRRLESEMRVYWWVTGGWSADAGKPFAELPLTEAAVLAAAELADRSATISGLFAAPALLSMVLERGRQRTEKPLSIAAAATAPDRKWRKKFCAPAAEESFATLVPITTALGLASISEDAADWQPRFERLTGLAPTIEISAEQLAIQMYREQLLLRAFHE